MKLTEKQVRHLAPREKPYKISDGHNLHILVQPNGSKYWRYKYHWLGKEKVLAFGVYPEVSLDEARELRSEARKLKRQGIDPREYQRTRKIRAAMEASNSFRRLALEWLEVRSTNWSPGYLKSVGARISNDILPEIGDRPVGTILPMDILKIVRTVERRDSLEVSRKALQICGQIFRYGIITGHSVANPADNLWPALKKRKVQSRLYLTPNELAQFLLDLETYQAPGRAVIALKLMLLTFVRTKELCEAQHSEFDLEHRLWRIPAERMKVQVPHLVPLSHQACALAQPLIKKPNRWGHFLPDTFTARKPISKNAMRNVLLNLGYKGKATVHGIRATASTILNESGLFSADAIERQLAHQEPNKIRKVYDHSNHLAERVRMMQWWADYLTKAGLKTPHFQREELNQTILQGDFIPKTPAYRGYV